MAKSSRSRRAVVAATTAVTLVGGAAMPVHASEIQRAYARHTATCIGLFFSDKAAHTAQCLPNNNVTVWTEGTTGSPLPVPPPVVVVPPPVVVVPPPVVVVVPPVVVVVPPPPPPVIPPPDSSYPSA